MCEIYRKDDDLFWKRIGCGILAGSALFTLWLAYGVVTWMLGVGIWNW